FFFSSRRRHTSFSRDWSSDVCSSDLVRRSQETLLPLLLRSAVIRLYGPLTSALCARRPSSGPVLLKYAAMPRTYGQCSTRPGIRSEERRVGKEYKSRRSMNH